jgi:hypothetical protein
VILNGTADFVETPGEIRNFNVKDAHPKPPNSLPSVSMQRLRQSMGNSP